MAAPLGTEHLSSDNNTGFCRGVGGGLFGPADVLSQDELPPSGPVPLRWKGWRNGRADTRPQWAEEQRRTKWPATVCFLPKENSCFSLLPLILFKGPGWVWRLDGNRDRATGGTGLWFAGNDNQWSAWTWRSLCDLQQPILIHSYVKALGKKTGWYTIRIILLQIKHNVR